MELEIGLHLASRTQCYLILLLFRLLTSDMSEAFAVQGETTYTYRATAANNSLPKGG